MNAAGRRAFMQRWQSIKEASDTHPYAQWVAVIDASTAPACAALHGKAWWVDGPVLSQAAEAHLSARIKRCRCRLRPMSPRALLLEGVSLNEVERDALAAKHEQTKRMERAVWAPSATDRTRVEALVPLPQLEPPSPSWWRRQVDLAKRDQDEFVRWLKVLFRR